MHTSVCARNSPQAEANGLLQSSSNYRSQRRLMPRRQCCYESNDTGLLGAGRTDLLTGGGVEVLVPEVPARGAAGVEGHPVHDR